MLEVLKIKEGKWWKNGKPLYAMKRLYSIAEIIVPHYTIGKGCPKDTKEIMTIVNFIVDQLSADSNITFTISPRSVSDALRLSFYWYPKSPMNKTYRDDQVTYRRLYYTYRLEK